MVFTQLPAAQLTVFFHLVCTTLPRYSNHKHRTAFIVYRIDRLHLSAAVSPSDFVTRDKQSRSNFRTKGSMASEITSADLEGAMTS